MNGPLSGITVVDLARLLPGDYGTAVLADLGAEVLKVEQPGVGDGLRHVEPYDDAGLSGAHGLLNRGKRSMTLDLKTSEGRAILLELLTRCDVLVDSFRPGVLERLRLGRAALASANPRLVHVSLTFFGHDSGRAEEAGHDINAQALAGLLELADGPQGGPALPYVQAADHAAGLQLAVAVLAGVHHRDRTGTGGFWDVAMVDAAYSMLGLAAGAYAASGAAPPRRDTLTGGLACYGLYACSDGQWIAVGALEPVFFQRLLAAVGLPGALAADQFDPAAQPALRERLATAFADHPRSTWLDRLSTADCCVSPVNDVVAAMGEEWAAARGLAVRGRWPFPRLGPVPRPPGGEPAAVAGRPAPLLGADTDSVLVSLGRTPDQVADLHRRGVV